MQTLNTVTLLIFYGTFLIVCGATAVILIGKKAKTALISGGLSGLLSFLTAWLIWQREAWGPRAGVILTLVLTLVFAWRGTATFIVLLQKMVTGEKEGLTGKGIAFLIISAMFVVSMIALILQVIFFRME